MSRLRLTQHSHRYRFHASNILQESYPSDCTCTYIHIYTQREEFSSVVTFEKNRTKCWNLFLPTVQTFIPPPSSKIYTIRRNWIWTSGTRSAKYISIRWNFRVSKYQLSVLFAFKTYSLTVMKYRAGAWHTSLVRPVIGRIFLFWFFSLPLSPSLQRLCPLYTSYDVNYRDLITMKNSWQMTAG